MADVLQNHVASKYIIIITYYNAHPVQSILPITQIIFALIAVYISILSIVQRRRDNCICINDGYCLYQLYQCVC